VFRAQFEMVGEGVTPHGDDGAMFFAPRCPGCGVVGPAPCGACVAEMAPAGPVPLPPSLDGCVALLDYAGPAREVVAQLKYRNARAPAAWLADGLAEIVRSTPPVDLVTWAPTTDARRRQRGFDHAELLARGTARRCRLPVRSLLQRTAGPAQTGRTLVERRVGPAFTATDPRRGLRVVVIDDVTTTGATFDAAGRALRSAGAAFIWGVAAAHPR
jgi:predicted amidophosphoribosyltransferase